MTRLPHVLLLSALATVPADLATIRSEPNLERRAGLAMEYAMKRVDAARAAWREGKTAETVAAFTEVGDAAELVLESLRRTGKNASRSPKHFKRAELNSRALLRRLDTLIEELSVDDREPAEKARARVRKVQEELLNDIMGGGRRR